NGRTAFRRLSAGHRHRVVEQQLVGDAGLRRDRLADRQDTGVLIGAVADIGEHVLYVGEGGQADERHTLPAHMREGPRLVAVIERHEVTADAGAGETAVW